MDGIHTGKHPMGLTRAGGSYNLHRVMEFALKGGIAGAASTGFFASLLCLGVVYIDDLYITAPALTILAWSGTGFLAGAVMGVILSSGRLFSTGQAG